MMAGRDPIDYIGILNRYEYVNSSPVCLIDPYGLAPATNPSSQPSLLATQPSDDSLINGLSADDLRVKT